MEEEKRKLERRKWRELSSVRSMREVGFRVWGEFGERDENNSHIHENNSISIHLARHLLC